MKPLIYGAIKIIGTVAVAVGVGTSCYYVNYNGNKEISDRQFNFDANDISNSEIVFDGDKDDAYGETPIITYGGSNGGMVNAYSHHSDTALFLYFMVKDETLLTHAGQDSEAWNEDCIEVYIDPQLDGGIYPQVDDFQLNFGLSGFVRKLHGSGTAWKAGDNIGCESIIKYNGTLNYEDDIDKYWSLEIRLPYNCLGAEITKNSPIAIDLGHSDQYLLFPKTSGGAIKTWYGLSGRTDNLKVASTTAPSGYIVLTGNDKLMSQNEYLNSLVTKPSIIGRILNENSNPVSGVSVSGYYTSVPSKKYDTVTDENGYFTYKNMSAEEFNVSFTKLGYNAASTMYTQDIFDSTNGDVEKTITMYTVNAKKINVKGKLVNVNTTLSNVRIELDGYPNIYTVTTSDGSFSLSSFNANSTFVVDIPGYEKTVLSVTKEQLSKSLGNIEIYDEMVEIGKDSVSGLDINSASVKVIRSLSGLTFKVNTLYEIAGNEAAEIFINTGNIVGFDGVYYDNDYRISLNEDGVSLAKYNEENKEWRSFNDANTEIVVSKGRDNGYQTYITVPYSLINQTKNDTVGLSYRFFNETDYNYAASNTADKKVNALATATYLRLNKLNESYLSHDNSDSNYYYYYYGISGETSENIPNNADRMYLTYERTSTGIQMNVEVENTLGQHTNTSTKLSGDEFVNLVLDLDSFCGPNWAIYNSAYSCNDINIRIYGNGDICYTKSEQYKNQASNQLWWSDKAHNNGTALKFVLESTPVDDANVTVTEGRGSTIYTFNFSYEKLEEMSGAKVGSITKDSKISFMMWEGSETSKTTVRFYTTQNSGWVIKNNSIITTVSTFGDQSKYIKMNLTEEAK